MNGLTDWLTSPLRGTLTGWQWLTLLAIPPAVVLLYFLKLKRHPIEVPSTFLWHRTIEDLHVNSIWQKLRQNLLLFLQLLLLLLAILACWRPSWEGTQFERDRKIFLVDTSASMSATDVAPSRLELAKQQILNIIDNDLKSGDVAMVISFSDRPIVEQS
ncbi:MAG: BatA and WFA domain-containing protein, partial [Planctomycetales bacterium]|nr:BatA and WFA domain-containing protein [Planctomycetales bacterium]